MGGSLGSLDFGGSLFRIQKSNRVYTAFGELFYQVRVGLRFYLEDLTSLIYRAIPIGVKLYVFHKIINTMDYFQMGDGLL